LESNVVVSYQERLLHFPYFFIYTTPTHEKIITTSRPMFCYKPVCSKKLKKTRKKLKRARKGRKQLAKTNFRVIPDRENLTVTAHLYGQEAASYHLKLTTKKGKKVIKSFLHLSPLTVQEIQLMQLLPGKYQLSLYAGVERRLVKRYDVNRY